ncbi:helix-turn-helix transcriptional regulator [Mesorhizobium sp. M0579]|uniref:helix-turn-helix domain-containing protein n=1 Tax=Mesorhizobium sp. M0579 TaxID=2956962 RepID=UPI00333CA215
MNAITPGEFYQIAEFDLNRQRHAMAGLDAERKRLAMPVAEMENRSGVSMNSFFSWRSVSREPTLGCLVCISQTLGFDVIMRRRKPGAADLNLDDLGAALAALDAERKRRKMRLGDMEEKSGVSANTFLAWKSGSRKPTLGCLVAIAQTLGFDVILKRRLAS